MVPQAIVQYPMVDEVKNRLNIKCSKPPTSYWDYPLVISNG
jgi:hypothetical protein